jgi:Short C-terminal domain
MRMGRAPMRRRGPGLVGAMARTAVVAGTATAVSGSVRSRQARNAEQAAPEPAPAPQPAPGITSETLASLERLADLRQQGVLTPEEFAVQKARLLGQ